MLMGFGFIHECAHILMGLLLGLKIQSLSIMPFGFNINFKDNAEIKKHNCKKILIAAAGPMLNFLIAVILIFVKQTPTIQNIIYLNILITLFLAITSLGYFISIFCCNGLNSSSP